tara:strand:+ start:660 stop:1217 length:558 start_codon:yes stop_codon:yes gene_type:complete
MARGISSDMATLFSNASVKPFILVNINFATPVYLWSGGYELNYDNADYIAAGDLLDVKMATESNDLSANGVQLRLSGLSGTNILTVALQQEYQGKAVDIKLGGFNDDGSIASVPVVVFSGFMDTMAISEGADTSSITLHVENKLIRMEHAKTRRYTKEDQKTIKADDKGFNYVSSLQEKKILWGR